MTKAKSYKHMDHTSGSYAAFLDKKREDNKKKAASKGSYKKSSAGRGGHRS